jgi:GNAT superfamily N-acetyltransferase
MSTGAGPSVRVRRIVEADLASFRELRLRALAMDPEAFGDTLEATQKADNSLWTDWVRRSSDSGVAITFLATIPEGQPIGMVGSEWKEGVTHLGTMWVEPRYRGLGVGGLLLDSVLAWSERVHPDSEMRLYVAPTQPAAVRLYQTRGFVSTGKDYPVEHSRGLTFHEMVRAPKVLRP